MTMVARIARNLREMSVFGPLFPVRHLGKVFGWPTVAVPSKLGTIHVRPFDTDAMTFNQVFLDRSYDLSRFPQNAKIMATYQQMLADGKKPVIIDAGANAGAAVRWFALRFPDAHIVAIEPDPGSAAVCRRNAQAFPNVIVVEAAIGATAGQVELQAGDKSWATTTSRTETGGVAIITVPQAVALVGEDASLFIVKVDIEGFETDLFSSDKDWARTAPVVMIEPHDWLFPGRQTTKNFMQTFADTDHEMLICGEETLVFVR